ncbi:hypothetical protein [Paracoccus sp. AK26]|uniref:hypothetical protein n=1 Tax=Paracoccus sp. AK26 TaxID=2589076 RepID=UPI001428174D|nr:hypothetical protein [Paracoccus sp. AK26]QIR85089.1 hypothetical protein FIU66_07625 [Paracoccus sp. AK26]
MIFLQLAIGLMIATVIYRWQKQIDRQTAVYAEIKKLCADYTAAARRAYFEQPYMNDLTNAERVERFFSISEREQEMYVARDQLYLLAPEAIVELVKKHDQCFRTWKANFPKVGQTDADIINASRGNDNDLRSSYSEMLDGMRLWLQTHSAEYSFIPKAMHRPK